MSNNGRLLVDRLLPTTLSGAPEALFGVRLLAIVLVAALGAFVSLGAMHLHAGNNRLALAQAAAAILATALVVALRRGLPRAPIAHAVIVLVNAQICLVSALYGGMRLPALAFFAVTPLIALMTVGRKAAVVWLALGVGTIVALAAAQALGVPFPMPPPPSRWIDVVALTILVVVTLIFAASHDSLSRRALEALRAANEELAASRTEAELANAAKDRLIATVSHELRTPLTGAIGFARLLDDAKLPAPHAEHARAALASGETLLALVNDILDRAWLAGGGLELHHVAFDLHRVLDETVRVGAVNASDRALDVVLQCQAPRFVTGDPVRLKQVLLNLVGNAVKFTPKGTVTLRVAPVDGRLRFAVVDTGVGIAPDVLSSLFEPFTHGDQATTQGQSGSGLGLSIAKAIVERMGGEIHVETELGKGSTFWFDAELPEAAPPAALAPHSERRAPLALRVLVVDDHAVNRLLAVRFLEKLGARAVAVPSGSAALDALGASAFDAVLLDCEMPEMDGYEVARRIRAAEPVGTHLPLVALTASALPEDRVRARAAGMDDLVTKPFDPEQLGDRLAAIVHRSA
ncbi:MAG: response regulator [Deltaproteobacteria bacterium]|nr:response regulator [Deltaproteobacteria bacterium]